MTKRPAAVDSTPGQAVEWLCWNRGRVNFRTRRKVKRIMHLSYASGYERGYDWNGYEVYEPVYTKPMIIGPVFVFVRGNEVRTATGLECLEYLDYSISMERKEKEALSQS